MGFIGFTENPKLASKITLFTALAPIARISYAKGLISLLKDFVDLEGLLYWMLGKVYWMSYVRSVFIRLFFEV